MNHWIHKFYQLSFGKRLVVIGVVYGLFMAGLGIYVLSNFGRFFNAVVELPLTETVSWEDKLQNLVGQKHAFARDYQQVKDILKDTVLRAEASNSPDKLWQEDFHEVAETLSDFKSDRTNEARALVMAKLLRQGLYPNYREMRRTSVGLLDALYDRSKSGQNVPLVEVLNFLRCRLIILEYADGILITKVVANGIDRHLVNTVSKMEKEGLIPEDQRLLVAHILEARRKDRMPLEQVIRNERDFCIDAILRFTHRYRVAAFALELIYGDPVARYRELMTVDNLKRRQATSKIQANLHKEHYLIQIAFPNFSHAYKNIVKTEKYFNLTIMNLRGAGK